MALLFEESRDGAVLITSIEVDEAGRKETR